MNCKIIVKWCSIIKTNICCINSFIFFVLSHPSDTFDKLVIRIGISIIIADMFSFYKQLMKQLKLRTIHFQYWIRALFTNHMLTRTPHRNFLSLRRNILYLTSWRRMCVHKCQHESWHSRTKFQNFLQIQSSMLSKDID